MTDYASSVAAAEPSWTWWMTTAAAAAMRMRNLREHHGGDSGHGAGVGGYGEADDEFAGPDRKRPRRFVKQEYWTSETEAHGWHKDVSQGHDSAAVGPLDLSVKATVTTTAAAAAAHAMDGRRAADGAGRKDVHAATTPVKRSTNANGRSSKKSTGKTTGGGGGTTAAAVKAATRKLLPQLLLDQRVDRSSPVSGTIIVPATPDQDRSTCRLTSPPSPYATGAECADADRQDDDYDGGDIDPEFNVVVATDEARRRLESIPNALGPYRCRLCSVRYVDAFALARHRCRCIVHVRYRCPECDKVFQCPANLASHRRWHGAGTKSSNNNTTTTNNNNNNNNNEDDANDKGTAENGNGEPDRETTANDDDDAEQHADEKPDGVGGTTATVPATAAPAVTINATGFKKNILQRAVQAAAAAAATHENTAGVAKNMS